jgi:hypothetical protein
MAIHKVLSTLESPGQNVPSESEPYNGPHLGGACVLRMILNSDLVNADAPSVPAEATEANQTAMYNTARAWNLASEPTGVWDLDPRAIKTALMNLDTGPRSYIEAAYTTKAEMNYRLMHTVWNYRIAPAVLTYAGKQWVAVTGFDSDGTPPTAAPPGVSYGTSFGTLQAIYVNDPAFYGPGTAFHMETADSWDSTYLADPVDKGTLWLGKYVAVCDPPEKPVSAPSERRRIKRSGNVLLKPAEAVEMAMAGVRERELQRDERVKFALERGRPGEPRLVYRADERDSYYYIVPLQTGDGPSRGSVGAVIVDARFGDLRSMVAAREPFPLFQLTPDDVRKKLTSQRIDIHDTIEASRSRILATVDEWVERAVRTLPASQLRARLVTAVEHELALARQPIERTFLRAETMEISSLLVWDCSALGMNAFYPFYVVHSAAMKIYVRAVDGQTLSEFLPCGSLRLGG